MKYFIIFLLLCSLKLTAHNEIKYSKIVILGEELANDFQFDSSITLFRKAINVNPNKPEAYLGIARIHLWYFLGSKQKEDEKLFMQYSDSALKKLEMMENENELTPDYLYLVGNIYKYRAMLFGTKQNTLDAFWATKKAVSVYEDVIEKDSSFYSAFGGIGIFEYALSYVPDLFNWALAISGLTADKNNGFNFIELAAQKGSVDKIEYQFHFAKLLDEHLAENEASLNILNKLTNKYSNNILFHYQKAIEQIKLRNLDLASKELQFVLMEGNSKFIQTTSFSKFLMGDVYFRKQNYKKALEYYLEFLISTTTIDYTGIASLRTAYCYYFLNNEREFKRYLLLAGNGNHDLEDDKYAYDESNRILSTGLTTEKKHLINIQNVYLSGHDTLCIKLSREIIDSVKSNNLKKEILVYKNMALVNLEQIDSVKLELDKILNNKNEIESWILPMTYFLQAKISYLKNDFIYANKYLEKAESYNDFEKRFYIQSLINGLYKKISK